MVTGSLVTSSLLGHLITRLLRYYVTPLICYLINVSLRYWFSLVTTSPDPSITLQYIPDPKDKF
ncbi:hypothetical protein BN1088_1433621 [Sphingobacterium sp. PM2-P1-29]|nr:hypothetical protein BN1088_1433621 [Sphingobacterium sp. PM2-P1-29]